MSKHNDDELLTITGSQKELQRLQILRTGLEWTLTLIVVLVIGIAVWPYFMN